VDPVPDPLLLRKSGSAGDRTRDLCICSQKLWPLDHRGGPKYSLATLILVFLLFWREYCWLSEFSPMIHSQYPMNRTGYESCSNPELFLRSCFFFGATAPIGPAPTHSRGFYITHNHVPQVSRTPLDEWLACRRDLYLTTQHSLTTSTISAGKRQ